MKSSLRRRLLAVAFLSLLSCAVSLFALAKILSLTTSQRADRAREKIVEQLATLHSGQDREAASQPGFVLGMRGGLVSSPAAVADLGRGIEEPDREMIERALQRAAETQAPAVLKDDRDSSIRYFAAEPIKDGGYAWISYMVPPPTFLTLWRLIVILLTLSTAFLVTVSLSVVVRVKRGVADLNASLAALADDLSAPVPRPRLDELAELGDGISRLAEALADARIEEERLGAELMRRENQ